MDKRQTYRIAQHVAGKNAPKKGTATVADLADSASTADIIAKINALLAALRATEVIKKS